MVVWTHNPLVVRLPQGGSAWSPCHEQAPGNADRMRDAANRAELSSVYHPQSVTARCGRLPITIVAGDGRCERWR